MAAGPLRKFLEQVDAGENKWAKWFFAKWLQQMPAREKARSRNAAASSAADTAPVHRAEHSTVQAESMEKGGTGDTQAQTPAPVPVGEFLSGDNPIVVVMGVLGILVALQVAFNPR